VLSKSTKQILISNIAYQITELAREQAAMKKTCAYWYTVADESNPHAFEMLNISRGFIRDVNSEIIKLAKCNNELKRSLAVDTPKRIKPKRIKPTSSIIIPEDERAKQIDNGALKVNLQAIGRQQRGNKNPLKIINIIDVTRMSTLRKANTGWVRDESIDRSLWGRSEWERENKILADLQMEDILVAGGSK
jgi:hypothetical protein